MSQFLSNKFLTLRASAVRGVERDQACFGCGYNLRGLQVGGSCPECGAPIQFRHLARDLLTEAPLPEIRKLRSGFHLATLVVLLFPVPLIAAAMGQTLEITCIALLMVGVLWVMASRLLTPSLSAPGAARRGFTDSASLRLAARWLQLGWPTAALLILATEVMPMTLWSDRILMVSTLASLLAGVAGLVMLSVLMEHLAEWCRNELAQQLFTFTAWTLPICTAGLLMSLIATPFLLLTCSLTLFWIAALVGFFLGLCSVGRSVSWSATHADEALDRARQLRTKMKASAVATMPPERQIPPGDIPLGDDQGRA